jgi:hypothetical protein
MYETPLRRFVGWVANLTEENSCVLSEITRTAVLFPIVCRKRNPFLLALQPLWALASFQFPDLFTIGRSPWTSYHLIARPLPKHRKTQTQNKHIYTSNTCALSWIRTHDHDLRASEDSSCLGPLGYRDRRKKNLVTFKLWRNGLTSVSNDDAQVMKLLIV